MGYVSLILINLFFKTYIIPINEDSFSLILKIKPKFLISKKINEELFYRYEISIEARGKKGNIIAGRFWTFKIKKGGNLEKTLKVNLPYKTRKVKLKFVDLNSGKETKKEIKLKWEKNFKIGNLIWLKKNNKFRWDNLWSSLKDTLKCFVKVIPSPDSFVWFIGKNKIAKTLKETLFYPLKNISQIGQYQIKVKIFKDGKKIKEVKDSFMIFDYSLLTDKEFLEFIEPLKYFAKKEDIEKLKFAKREEREKALEDFWKKYDPTPSTKRNELKEEFLRRLYYVNKHFSLPYKKGYKTDRGKIYLIFGPPDHIERYIFEWGIKDREIWHYYNLRKVFIFEDKTGTGDYELIYPISIEY
ncbi:hypothetical protein DRN73_09940 [Candidatus Pacearchaeota archaeon]|nr:MAG: hypothetical protein DRN73_09940 [Candidatus Pacearchaeota archaeon]